MRRVLFTVVAVGLVFPTGCGTEEDGGETVAAAAEQALMSVDSAGIESACLSGSPGTFPAPAAPFRHLHRTRVGQIAWHSGWGGVSEIFRHHNSPES